MTRHLVSTLLALLGAVAVFGASAGPALAETVHYRAEPATPQAQARLIVKDLIWKCGPAGCIAGKSNSRPAIDCPALARQIGTLRSFTVAGQALPAEALEKCNARAR